MKKFIAEPLFHFLLIGAALFVGFSVFQNPDDASDNKIVITENDTTVLAANFARTWQRQPTAEELQGLVEGRIRDEIAYREALAMGLDRDDAYIRRRLRMKMEMMLEDIGEQMVPTDEELTDFLNRNPELFRQDPQIRFSHVFLNSDTRKESLEENAQVLLKQLVEAGPDIDPEQFGDTIMLPKTYPLSSLSVISRQLGDSFAKQLSGLTIGQWQGPILSSYGYHLVLVQEFIKSSNPELSEIRSIVEREFMAKQRKDLKEKTYTTLRERYRIVMEQGSGS